MDGKAGDGSEDESNEDIASCASATIDVFVAMGKTRPIFEELPVRPLSETTFELLASPGLALSLAKGDIIEIVDQHKVPVVLKRGGNFCIQIYSDSLSREEIARLEDEVAAKLGGTLDGIYRDNLAISIPASSGMNKINALFDEFRERTGVAYYYCNVYKNPEDLTDETLLNWWL